MLIISHSMAGMRIIFRMKTCMNRDYYSKLIFNSPFFKKNKFFYLNFIKKVVKVYFIEMNKNIKECINIR